MTRLGAIGPTRDYTMRMTDLIKTALYLLIQATWGLPQTVAGLVVWLACWGCPRSRYRCAFVTTWRRRDGLSLGPFVFMPDMLTGATNADRNFHTRLSQELLVHEYGHTIQSLVFGPLYLPVFAIPSFVWAGAPAFRRRRREGRAYYYDFYPEKFANRLGERVTGLRAPHKREK